MPPRKSSTLSIIPKVEEKIRQLRATKMVEDRVFGLNHKQLAAKYKMSTQTVQKELRYAIDNNLVERLEERILNELVPLAIDTYKKKMQEDTDAFVAKDVLTNLARLSEKIERREETTKYSLKAYLEMKGQTNDSAAKAILTTTTNISNSLIPALTSQDETEDSEVIDTSTVDERTSLPSTTSDTETIE
jgi:hypothetical protein